MKKYIFYLAFFLISTLSFGQETEDEKIESLKTAFITEALSLTPEEAQAFWPIYNLFEDKKERGAPSTLGRNPLPSPAF